MIDDPRGAIDYDEAGQGPTLVFVPGSCSTGAAWRPVIAALGTGFRTVTTSLPGYGCTAERRTEADPAIAHEVDAVEAVIARAGGAVHLVGHSYGGLVSLAVALAGRTKLASLTILEAPAIELLPACGADAAYATFRAMFGRYLARLQRGDADAVAEMVDFYAGQSAFAGWPQKVRDYAVATTPVNVLDWQTAYATTVTPDLLAQLGLPVLVIRGGDTAPAMQEVNALLAANIPGARLVTLPGAAHFMIATHPAEVARLIAANAGASRKMVW